MPVRERSVLCQQVLVFVIVFLFLQINNVAAQCGTGTAVLRTIDFSAAKDTSWSFNASRVGTACVGTSGADDRCIRLNIIVNPGTDLINFTTTKITGASFYSINCGPLISIGTPACIKGLSTTIYYSRWH